MFHLNDQQVKDTVSELDAATYTIVDTEVLPTKICPQCGQELFADMMVCYGCLYDFSREHIDCSPMLPDPDVSETGELGLTYSRGFFAPLEEDAQMVEPVTGGERTTPSATGGLGLFIQTGDIDLTVPLPVRGLMVGRLPINDIVLHSRAVSKQHVLIVPSGGGAVVEDQGSTNLAVLRGREVAGSRRMSLGDTLSICGTLLTLVDEPPSLNEAS